MVFSPPGEWRGVQFNAPPLKALAPRLQHLGATAAAQPTAAAAPAHTPGPWGPGRTDGVSRATLGWRTGGFPCERFGVENQILSSRLGFDCIA